MTEYKNLIYEVSADKKTAFITLNRPDKLNALSMALSDEIVQAVRVVQESRRLKNLVFKGAGGNFCVGDDITEMPRWGDANGIMRRARFYQAMANAIEELDKITVLLELHPGTQSFQGLQIPVRERCLAH